METKDQWHYSHTLAGKPKGRIHFDIGGDDGSCVALVYPSEDGDQDTLRKAKLIAGAPVILRTALRFLQETELVGLSMVAVQAKRELLEAIEMSTLKRVKENA